jgi:hypothetical protein
MVRGKRSIGPAEPIADCKNGVVTGVILLIGNKIAVPNRLFASALPDDKEDRNQQAAVAPPTGQDK